MAPCSTRTSRPVITIAGFVIAAITTAPSALRSAVPVSYELDRFEASGIRIVQPNTSDQNKYLWNLYGGYATGPTDLSTVERFDGARSLHSRYDTGSDWQFQFYTYTEGLAGFSNGWQFMRRFVTDPASWQTGRVNRMRFWIKLPPGPVLSTYGNHNFQFGTYIRCSTCGGAEDGGGHFYHHYDLTTTGQWEQIIVDTHPNHSRGDDGNAERGDRLHPTQEPGYTYFDLLTRFYLDFPYTSFSQPAHFYMDGFEVFEEQRPENTDQVYSVHSVYVPATNKVAIGWMRRKDEDQVRHDVRYAFSDVFSIGWASATPAPGGTITAPGSGGYNGMSWSTTALNLAGRTVLYVAIKPQNSALFRQIAIPLSSASGTPPSAPVNLRITGS